MQCRFTCCKSVVNVGGGAADSSKILIKHEKNVKKNVKKTQKPKKQNKTNTRHVRKYENPNSLGGTYCMYNFVCTDFQIIKFIYKNKLKYQEAAGPCPHIFCRM